MARACTLVGIVLLGLGGASAAWGYDAEETFRQGVYVLSLEAGGGAQHNLERQRFETGLEFWNIGARISVLPFGPTLSGPFHGALEIGLEPCYQRYTAPVDASFAGLGAVVKYHVLSLGRFVPYVEVMGAAGWTDLQVAEVDSSVTFLVHGGVGAEFFLTDRVAFYAGYRLQHVSNGNTSRPNRGFESQTGVAGVSYFLK